MCMTKESEWFADIRKRIEYFSDINKLSNLGYGLDTQNASYLGEDFCILFVIYHLMTLLIS